MVNKEDLDVHTLRLLDRMESIEKKLDRLIDEDGRSMSRVFDNADIKEYFNISNSSLSRYRERGLKSFTSGSGKRLYNYEDVLEFVRGGCGRKIHPKHRKKSSSEEVE